MAAAGDLLGLLLALLFLALVGSTIATWPVIGPPIRHWLDSFQPKFEAVKQHILFPIITLSAFFSAGLRWIHNIVWYVPQGILGWINDAEEVLGDRIATLQTRVLGWVNDAESILGNRIAELHTQALSWVNDAEAALGERISTLQARALSWVNGAEATLGNRIIQYGNNLQDAINSAKSLLTGQIATLQASALRWINDAERTLRGETASDVGSLRDMISSLQKALASSDAQTAEQVAALSVAIAGVTEALSDLEKNCVNKLCFNLSDLADTIGDLDDAAILAAIIDIVSMAASRPGAAADLVQNMLGGTVQDVSEFVNKL